MVGPKVSFYELGKKIVLSDAFSLRITLVGILSQMLRYCKWNFGKKKGGRHRRPLIRKKGTAPYLRMMLWAFMPGKSIKRFCVHCAHL